MPHPPHPTTILTIILLILLTATASSAQQDDTPIITPDTPFKLHDLKLLLESLREYTASTPQQKLIYQSQHLDNRFAELRADTANSNNTHTEKLLQKIQQKQTDIQTTLTQITKECPGCITTTYKNRLNNHSNEVLTSLLADPGMPIQSKNRLNNALNHSNTQLGKSITRTITANQAQSFSVSKHTTSIIPFTQAMYYDPTYQKWYSIIITQDKATLSDGTLTNPEYYLYPTKEQMQTLMVIYNNINTDHTISWKNKVRLTMLWMNIPKTETKQQEI